MKIQPQRFFVGCRVIATASGWTGVIVRKNPKNRSSPWVCCWDKTGGESNVNSMVVRVVADDDGDYHEDDDPRSMGWVGCDGRP